MFLFLLVLAPYFFLCLSGPLVVSVCVSGVSFCFWSLSTTHHFTVHVSGGFFCVACATVTMFIAICTITSELQHSF